MSVGDVTVDEGDIGTTDMTFTVSLSAPSDQTVTVDYATANGTATQPADYTQAAARSRSPPARRRKTVTVTVKGDTLDENDETFTVGLSNPVERDDRRRQRRRDDHRRRPARQRSRSAT